ncbi:uncharacterized protein BX663DRAFT_516382 [Cokeromyces recurvatus]|uniref:uncharacterized protein n=1 Tax=Cokeromyces recurvatus TaxID=90255 RepID=UPI002220A5DB|nr:uncharacterized protein BX663DRAFT_516382 [Cokeromyces recurvatus]KAI7900748.1 hypothetical protein BX663DRAFT_516382 [Cokeromyces recurvatus]
MQRLWHRLSRVPSRSTCIYCHTISNNSLLLPLKFIKRTPALPTQRLLSWLTWGSSSTENNENQTGCKVNRNNRAIIMADFYRSLSTQDIDQIWPLYTYLYDNDMLVYLTRKNFHDIFVFTIRSQASQKNLQRLLAIVEDMRRRRFVLRLSEYTAIINWTGGKTVPEKRTHHLTEALRWFDEMQQDFYVDEQTGEKMAKEPLKPSVPIFNILIHIATQLKDLTTAQKLYHEMRSIGLKPDRYTYSTLLHAMGRLGDMEGMNHLLTEIKKHRLRRVIKSTAVWNVIMSGYARNGVKDEAYSIFHQMVEANYKKKKKGRRKVPVPRADSESFRIYIDSLVSEERQSEAIRTYDKMKVLKLKPTMAIYNILFRSFMNPLSADQSVLKRIYQEMKTNQVKPNSETMYTLVSAFLDLGDTKSGLEAFVELSQLDNNTEKSLNVKTTAVASLAKDRLWIKKKTEPSKIEPTADLLDRLNHLLASNNSSKL